MLGDAHAGMYLCVIVEKWKTSLEIPNKRKRPRGMSISKTDITAAKLTFITGDHVIFLVDETSVVQNEIKPQTFNLSGSSLYLSLEKKS